MFCEQRNRPNLKGNFVTDDPVINVICQLLQAAVSRSEPMRTKDAARRLIKDLEAVDYEIVRKQRN